VKRWWLVLALVLSVGVNLGILATLLVARRPPPPLAEAPPPSAGQHLRRPPYIERMADELHLTGEKRRAFIDVQERFYRTMIEERRRVEHAQRGLRRQLAARHPDRQAIDRHLAELTQGRMALERALVDALLDSRALLDPRQERRFMRFMSRLRQELQRSGRGGRPPTRTPNRPPPVHRPTPPPDGP